MNYGCTRFWRVMCAVCCVLCAKMVGVPFKLKVFRASFVFLHEDFKRENNALITLIVVYQQCIHCARFFAC